MIFLEAEAKILNLIRLNGDFNMPRNTTSELINEIGLG